MSLVAERGVQRTRATEDTARRRFAGVRLGGGGLTLGQTLDRVWEGLHAAGVAECPVCHGRMTAGATAPARCGDCGSRRLLTWRNRRPGVPLPVPARQSRAPERKPAFEESPDTAERGGWVTDPGKPAGKCHRNKPPKRRATREPVAGKGEKVR